MIAAWVPWWVGAHVLLLAVMVARGVFRRVGL